MLKITIELIPLGIADHPRRRVIASGEISLTHGSSQYLGDYNYTLQKKTGRSARRGKVYNFPRRSKDEWDLLGLVLDDFLAQRRAS